MLSLSDFETKFDRKKSQTNQVAICFHPQGIPPSFFTCLSFFNVSVFYSFFYFCSYQRQTRSTTSYSRSSAKMNCSNRVSFRFSHLDDKDTLDCYILETEYMCLPQGYTCALQRDMLYQGKMFVSQNWICFHSKVFGKDIKVYYKNIGGKTEIIKISRY